MISLLLWLFAINQLIAIGDATLAPTSTIETSTAFNHETTQGYVQSFEAKCLADFQYEILIKSFIKQTAKEIQMNRSSEAMTKVNTFSPDDDRFVQDIVTEALKQTDVKLLYLLEFVNQTKFPATKFNGFLEIFYHLNKINYTNDRYNPGYNVQTVLNWLDFVYFVRSTVDNNSATSTEMVKCLSDVQDKAKNVVLKSSNYTLTKYDDFNRGKVKFGSEHISFIIKSCYNNNPDLKNMIRFLELYTHSMKGQCVCPS